MRTAVKRFRCQFQPVSPSSHVARRAAATTSVCGANGGEPAPGPPRWPFVGNMFTADLARLAQYNGMKPMYEKYGPAVHFSLPGTELLYISDVELQREVLKEKQTSFTNGDSFRLVFGWFFPTSVIVVEGEQWKRIRRVIQRAIQGQRLSEAVRPLHLVASRAETAFCKPGEPVDVHQVACGITLDAFGFWAYDVDFNTIGGENPEILNSCIAITEVLMKRIHLPFPILWKLPTHENREAKKGLETIRAHAGRLLDERLNRDMGEGSQPDLLSAMVVASRAEPDAKNSMTREELIDNIGTIFFGAYDTTSSTVSFTMSFLANNPRVQATLAAELRGLDLATATKDEVERLPYLDMVCKESQRLCPTAPAVARTALEDVQIGKFSVKGGTNVVVDFQTIPAKSPDLWGGQTDLEEFRPERWGEMKPHRLASLPFGFGSRICPGSTLAVLEHKFIVAYLVQKYNWNPDPARPMEVTLKLGYTPKEGCWLIPEPRS